MHHNIWVEKRIWPLCTGILGSGSGSGSGGSGNNNSDNTSSIIAAFHRSLALELSDIDSNRTAYSIREDGSRIDPGFLYTINLGYEDTRYCMRCT